MTRYRVIFYNTKTETLRPGTVAACSHAQAARLAHHITLDNEIVVSVVDFAFADDVHSRAA